MAQSHTHRVSIARGAVTSPIRLCLLDLLHELGPQSTQALLQNMQRTLAPHFMPRHVLARAGAADYMSIPSLMGGRQVPFRGAR